MKPHKQTESVKADVQEYYLFCDPSYTIHKTNTQIHHVSAVLRFASNCIKTQANVNMQLVEIERQFETL